MKTNQTRPSRFSFPFDIGLALFLLAISGKLCAQPVPHHFSSIAVGPDQTVTLALNGSVSNMFNLTGTISNQFMQMFDLYPVDTSTNLLDWTRLALLLRTNNNPNPRLFQDTNAAGLGQRFYRTSTNHLLTAFPIPPSGPFAVGTVDRVMMDPARTNLYRLLPPTNAFMVTFWYPADPPAPGVPRAAMWNKRLAADRGFIQLFISFGVTYTDLRWTNIVPKLVGHRFGGVPLAAGAARYPVVIYSHGFAGMRQFASQTAEELASHGYVVMAPDHPDCYATEYPDGRYLTRSGNEDVTGRLKDMAFLVDELARLDQGDTLFAGRLDLDRVAVSGQSAGGMVVETCRTNSRVKCAATWEGANLKLNSNGLQKPFLIAVGQNGFPQLKSDNQWLFDKATTNAIMLEISGADHITATDIAWTWQIPWGRAPALAYNACLLWFLDTYLKGETRPFPTNPEIYNVQRK